MRRVLAMCILLATAVTGLSACGEGEDLHKEELLRIIAATRPLAHEFVYVDSPNTGTELRVVGLVEDAFRFKARLSVNGTPVKEEVAVDDALGVRFLDPGKIGLFVDEKKAGEGAKPLKTADGKPLPSAIEALQAGRWVVDPTGAPSLVRRADIKRLEGEDPVLDALTVLDYVTRIVEANGAVRYNKDALEPTYKPKEDRFPKPSQGAEVKRYDVPLRRFPKASDQGGTNVVIVPGVENFRKLAVFVKDGRIIEVREDIDVASRMDDLRRNFDVETQFTVEQAVNAINDVRKSKGEDVFRPRKMQFQLVFSSTDTVGLPGPEESLEGPLSFLRFRGADVPKRSTSGGATTTTAPAPDGATGGHTIPTTVAP
ncbi:MAG TPA: hypothetical protein VF230_01920 [Acidimicrobiales bacterium]